MKTVPWLRNSCPSHEKAKAMYDAYYKSNLSAPVTSVTATFTANNLPDTTAPMYLAFGYWMNDGTFGYFGMQPNSTGAGTSGQTNFSLWNATFGAPVSPTAITTPFSGEGTGERMMFPTTWQTGSSYTISAVISNHQLIEYVTNNTTNVKVEVGYITLAANQTSFSSFSAFSEDYGYPSNPNGPIPVSDLTISNMTLNGQANSTSYSGVVQPSNPANLYNIQQVGDNTFEAVTGNSSSEVITANNNTPYVFGGPGLNTLQLTSSAYNISADSINNIQFLDINGQAAVMTAAEYNSFTLIQDSIGGGSITLTSAGTVMETYAVRTYNLIGNYIVFNAVHEKTATIFNATGTNETLNVHNANFIAGSQYIGSATNASTDSIVFDGVSSDYSITNNNNQTLTITDGHTGRDGTITIQNIDNLVFTDKTVLSTVYLGGSGTPSPPTIPSVTLDMHNSSTYLVVTTVENFATANIINAPSSGGSVYFTNNGVIRENPLVSSYLLNGNDTFNAVHTGIPLTINCVGSTSSNVINIGAANLVTGSTFNGCASGGNQVIFSGNETDYSIVHGNNNGFYTITDSHAGRDGTITVSNVAELSFADNNKFITNPNGEAITSLYVTTFGRQPDAAGLSSWEQAYNQAGNTSQALLNIANNFISSPEFTNKYGNISTMNHTDFVTEMYTNTLHRLPDAAGLAAWVKALDHNQVTPNQVVIGFATSTENYSNMSSWLILG